MEGYSAKVTASLKDIDFNEKVKATTGTHYPLNEVATGDTLNIMNIITVAVHNPMSKQNEKYNQYVIITPTDTYVTSSDSFYESVKQLFDMHQDEFNADPMAVMVRIVRRPSKNFSGEFLTADYVNFIEEDGVMDLDTYTPTNPDAEQ